MGRGLLTLVLVAGVLTFSGAALGQWEKDVIKTSAGDLEITFIGHGTLAFGFGGKVIHVDPWTQLGDYSKMPKADLILITHEHRDHLDLKAVQMARTDMTKVIATKTVAGQVEGAIVMSNGDTQTIGGVKILAVPAYNIVSKRDTGEPYHPKGTGNGYVITFADKTVYVAGDTENVPEIKALKEIDVAFLPMNLPFTMTPEMVADAARAIQPKILYPYHFGETDAAKIGGLLQGTGIEMRIRKMK